MLKVLALICIYLGFEAILSESWYVKRGLSLSGTAKGTIQEAEAPYSLTYPSGDQCKTPEPQVRTPPVCSQASSGPHLSSSS